MGDILSCKCRCGYSETLNTGCGIASDDLNSLREVLGEESFEIFNERLMSGEIDRWYIYNAVISCPNCKKLYTVPTVHIEERAENQEKKSEKKEKKSALECPVCGEECTELLNLKKVKCPQCRAKPVFSAVGFWD